MGLVDDLKSRVAQILRAQWSQRDGRVVPAPEDLTLGNDAVHFDRATVLYADLSGSTKLVDSASWMFAAEIYKTYLHCAATLIRSEGGAITSYDGDRVMGIFVGDIQTTPAAQCALKINYAVQHIINPALKAQYSNSSYIVKQVVGIDTSEIWVARTGVRGGNDLVWVGKAANYAAKLSNLDLAPRSWVTNAAFDKMADEAKYGGNPRQLMWSKFTWNAMGGIEIYGSTWWRKP